MFGSTAVKNWEDQQRAHELKKARQKRKSAISAKNNKFMDTLKTDEAFQSYRSMSAAERYTFIHRCAQWHDHTRTPAPFGSI